MQGCIVPRAFGSIVIELARCRLGPAWQSLRYLMALTLFSLPFIDTKNPRKVSEGSDCFGGVAREREQKRGLSFLIDYLRRSQLPLGRKKKIPSSRLSISDPWKQPRGFSRVYGLNSPRTRTKSLSRPIIYWFTSFFLEHLPRDIITHRAVKNEEYSKKSNLSQPIKRPR